MTVYVDPLMNHGWILRGRPTKSCHMFADTLGELHSLALWIGMKRSWFQDHKLLPHYDLTLSRRTRALQGGAIEATQYGMVEKIRAARKAKAKECDRGELDELDEGAGT